MSRHILRERTFLPRALSFTSRPPLKPHPTRSRLASLLLLLCTTATAGSPPLQTVRMSQGAEFSARRSQTSELVGEETGLPMIICPQCKRARVTESRSKKDNANFGRVYVKCSRNFTWVSAFSLDLVNLGVFSV